MFSVRFRHCVLFPLTLLVGLVAGCQGTTTTAENDAKALQREGERLRKEHQKEMYNK